MKSQTNKILQSERLYLRQLSHFDLENLFRLDSDAEVMKYIRTSCTDKELLREGLSKMINYYEEYPGFGVWPAIEKETNNFIGWFCLKQLDQSGETEIGYRLLKEYWSRGYATEMATKLLAYGFSEKKLDHIAGITHPENINSQKVLTKIGLKYVKQAHYYNKDVNYYSVSKEEHATKAPF